MEEAMDLTLKQTDNDYYYDNDCIAFVSVVPKYFELYLIFKELLGVFVIEFKVTLNLNTFLYYINNRTNKLKMSINYELIITNFLILITF